MLWLLFSSGIYRFWARTYLVYSSQQISTSLKLYQCVTTAVKATATTERLSPGPPRSSAIEVAVLFSSAIHRLLLDTALYVPLALPLLLCKFFSMVVEWGEKYIHNSKEGQKSFPDTLGPEIVMGEEPESIFFFTLGASLTIIWNKTDKTVS